jgi:hypothetical protein
VTSPPASPLLPPATHLLFPFSVVATAFRAAPPAWQPSEPAGAIRAVHTSRAPPCSIRRPPPRLGAAPTLAATGSRPRSTLPLPAGEEGGGGGEKKARRPTAGSPPTSRSQRTARGSSRTPRSQVPRRPCFLCSAPPSPSTPTTLLPLLRPASPPPAHRPVATKVRRSSLTPLWSTRPSSRGAS